MTLEIPCRLPSGRADATAGAVNVVDSYPLDWPFITRDTMEKLARTDSGAKHRRGLQAAAAARGGGLVGRRPAAEEHLARLLIYVRQRAAQLFADVERAPDRGSCLHTLVPALEAGVVV